MKRKKSRGPAETVDLEAAHQRPFSKLTNFGVGFDIAAAFAHKSRKSGAAGDDIASIQNRYEEIAEELRCCEPAGWIPLSAAKKKKLLADVTSGKPGALAACIAATSPKALKPSLSEQLRGKYQTDDGARCLVADIKNCIDEHLLFLSKGEASTPRLHTHLLGATLVELLSRERLRDRKTLEQFLLALLKRWRKFDEPDSTWRRKLVVHQTATKLGHDRVAHLKNLQAIGAIPKHLSAQHRNAYLERIGQDISRDLRIAPLKQQTFRGQ
jgi:hypothetical protein